MAYKSERLVRRGTLYVPATVAAFNTNDDRNTMADRVRENNTAVHLQHEFFTLGTENVLQISHQALGGKTAIIIPRARYAEESVMIIAAGPDSFAYAQTKTEFIYDYPMDTQLAYWRLMQQGLQGFHAITPPAQKDQYSILATENNMAVVTSGLWNTSRSINLPHAHIFRIHHADIKEEKDVIPHLVTEQRFLQRKAKIEGFVNALEGTISAMSQEWQEKNKKILPSLVLNVRDEEPYGYEFSFPRGTSIEEIAVLMHMQHASYQGITQPWHARLKHKRRVIPQPSVRSYSFLNKQGEFSIAISPEFLSHAGVLEAAGLNLRRGVQYPPRHEEQELEEVRRRLLTFMQ